MTNNEPRVIQGGVAANANPARGGNRGPLVEDTSVAGGVDRQTGAPVIRPKTADGKGDGLNETTDPRERR